MYIIQLKSLHNTKGLQYSGAKPNTKEEEYLDKYLKKNGTRISYWRLEVGGREKDNKD